MKPWVAAAVTPFAWMREAFLKPKADLYFMMWSTHSRQVLFAQGMLVLMSIPSIAVLLAAAADVAVRSWKRRKKRRVGYCGLFVCLLFYVLVRSKVISEWVPTCDSAHKAPL